MKTAVDFLINGIRELTGINIDEGELIIKQAKEMEKDQIKDAWLIDGYYEPNDELANAEFEEYYNETFKTK